MLLRTANLVSSPFTRIHDSHACGIEVAPVESHNREIVRKRSRSNEAVLDRHRAPLRAEHREQLSPAEPRRGLPRNALQPLHSVLEPARETASAAARREQQNAESDLTQNDRIDGDLRLVAPQPVDYARIRGGLGRLR